MKVLDSFAWIEYLKGSARGASVKPYVDGREPLYTPSICLTEVKSRYLRDQRDPTRALSFMTGRSFIVPLTQDIALRAADVKELNRLHTVDAIIYATGLQRNAAVVTGDQHFKGLPNVEMI